MLTLGYVTVKHNHPHNEPSEIAVIPKRINGQWWCASPGDWGKQGPIWVECERVEEVA